MILLWSNNHSVIQIITGIERRFVNEKRQDYPVLVLFARFWRFWKLIELLFFRVLFLVSTHHLAKFSSINLTENIYYHRFIELKGDRGPSSFWCLRNRHFNHDHKRKYILVISELSLQESTKSSIFDIWYLQLVKLD